MTINRQTNLIRDFLRKTYNKEVLQWFADISDNDIDTVDGVSLRKAARNACLIRPRDSLLIMQLKQSIFRQSVQKTHLKPDIYGLPTTTFHESVVYMPQIVIHWKERIDIAAINKRYPIRAQCSVRFKGSYGTEAEIKALGLKIQSIFNPGNIPHHWTKGRNKYSYRDKLKQYEMIITAGNIDDAKSVINAMLSIQDDNPLNEEYLTISTVDRNWNKKEVVKVNGKNAERPTRRPIGEVYYTHAEFKVHGLTKDIVLNSRLPTYVATSLI